MPETDGGHEKPGTASPYRYTAAVFGTGQIREIVESIGVRIVRTLDPKGREGRRLLNDGRVGLWRISPSNATPCPVTDFLDNLGEEVEQQRGRHADDERWKQHCAHRLETIRSWRQIYTPEEGADH